MNEPELSDLNLLHEQEKPFLADVLDINSLVRGQANLIVAPCHSGKTTAAKKILATHCAMPSCGLLLIDTTSGRDSLLKHQNAQRTPYEIVRNLFPFSSRPEAIDDRFITMTYYAFGMYVRCRAPELDHFDVIICDEMHNLIRYLAIEESNNKKNYPEGFDPELGDGDLEYSCALDYLLQKAASAHPRAPLIVMMTATPRCLYRKFDELHTPYMVFDYTGKVRSDTIKNIHHYANFQSLIQKIDTRALIYVPTIQLIQKFSAMADNGSRKIMCLWSLHNSSYPMSEAQLDLRHEILQAERIPSDIDLLFINAAYETSINIRNEDFNTIIIHTSNTDAQIQARGRLRHDIQDMYLYDASHQYIMDYFPKEYLNVPLSAADRESIAQSMALANVKGRPLKWSSIASMLLKSGCHIESSRISNQRYYTVSPPSISA